MTSRAFAEVIGNPIEHSKSPAIHGLWLQRLTVAADYRRTRVTRSDLPMFLAARRADPAWRGCNVTMPLKPDALELADECTDDALAAGASNCLFLRAGRLWAGNTDIGGVKAVVSALAGTAPQGSVTVLGTGGAARAVLVALKQLGFSDVVIQGRDQVKAAMLADRFEFHHRPRLFGSPVVTEGLINATSLGMAGQPLLDVDLAGMPQDGWAFDLVTAPARTPLLLAAEQRGLRVSGGTSMLVEQAAAAFTLFFGQDPPRDPETEAQLSAMLTR